MLVFLFLAFLDELHTGIIVASDDIALPHFLSEVMQCLLVTERKKKFPSKEKKEGSVVRSHFSEFTWSALYSQIKVKFCLFG